MTIDIACNTIEEVGEEGADDGGQDRQSNQQHDCCADEERCHDVEDDGEGVGGDDVVHKLSGLASRCFCSSQHWTG